MANRINTFLVKRSNTPGKIPTAGSLLLGEIALNTADAKLYTSGTTAGSILPIGWDRVSRTGDTMTGTLYGPSISATTISATTYYNLPNTTFTGGTVTGGTNFTGGISATTYNGYTPANQDGTILYHSLQWFTPSGTVSNVGSTVTSSLGQFTSTMINAKLTISGESRIITGFTSSTVVTVNNAYSQNYTGVPSGTTNWGVYSRSFSTIDTSASQKLNVFYSNVGTQLYYIDVNGNNVFTPTYTVFGSNLEVGSTLINTNYIALASGNTIQWSNDASNEQLTKDLGIRKNSPGILEIYDGVTSGGALANRRDLLVRTMSASTISATTYLNLPNTTFTGGTVTGATNFTNGLTANTFSATSINKVDYIVFNTGTTSAATVAGTVYFDNTEKALSYNTSVNQGVTVNLGQQQYLRVFNNSGTAIPKGKALEVLSAYSGLPSVTLAINKHTGFDVVGVSAEAIPNNSEGIVITNGIISNITLTGISVGSLIYASDSVPGQLDNATKYLSFPLTARTNSVGYVIQTGATTGKLFVDIRNENKVLAFTDLERDIIEGNIASTGAFIFSGISLATSTTFNVGTAQGWIIDNLSNPLKPDAQYVYYSGQTGLTTPYLLTATETYILLNSGGTLTFLNTFPTPQQRRQNIYLGKLGHANKTSLINAFNEADFDISPLSQLRDMFTPIHLINSGVILSPNGANLNFNNSAGTLWGMGIGFTTNQLNPNSISISGSTPVTFQYRTQTGGTATNTTAVVPGNYDLNGVITAIGSPAKQATNQRIYLVQNGVFRIQYGQTIYADLTLAVAAAQTEAFNTFSNFTDNGILIGILSLRSDTTNLSDPLYAKFSSASKFGEVLGGTGGLSTTTLQQAYNNSAQPEIVTNSTLGGLSIQNGAGSADNITRLLEGLNTAGNVTSFIRADGYISGTTIQTNGTFLNSNGLTATTVSATTIITPSVTANATGLSATTISATTYYNLPTSGETKYWSGGTGLNSVVQSKSNSLAGGIGALAGGSGNTANSNYSVALGLNSSANGSEILPVKTQKTLASGMTININIDYQTNAIAFSGDVYVEWYDYFYGQYGSQNSFLVKDISGNTQTVLNSNVYDIYYNTLPVSGKKTVISGITITGSDPNNDYPAVVIVNDHASEWQDYLYSYGFLNTFILNDGVGNTYTLNYNNLYDIYFDVDSNSTYIVESGIPLTSYNSISGTPYYAASYANQTQIILNNLSLRSYSTITGTTFYDVSTNFNRPAFVMGSNSIVTGGNSVVLGANITGSSNNTTYVDTLNIKTTNTGETNFNTLAITSNGTVVKYIQPITIINNSSLFSTGIYAGINVSAVTNSNFFGTGAGNNATNANNSNFIGLNAGINATSAYNSNFFGQNAGSSANNASGSNFIGPNAGYNASNAYSSNFFGPSAGGETSGATQSNFFGASAGYFATGASNSNFFGQGAGNSAKNASQSNFFGQNAGVQATDANNSNFMGYLAGYGATSASHSNFMGYLSGYQASGATGSNFLGRFAGLYSSNAFGSNFLGYNSGRDAYNAYYSNFFGNLAGYAANSANNSNFIGQNAGYNASNAYESNFMGWNAGQSAGLARNSNFFGRNAGQYATSAYYSNFFGYQAGYSATDANYSNFFGINAGWSATGANSSNFFGQNAGYYAKDALYSNFFGTQAGNVASNATYSNFFGRNAGDNAINASQSNFFGFNAGQYATGASYSNFFGRNAGQNASAATFSNLFGLNVGKGDVLGSIGSNNIIIGTNISLPSGTTNSLNLGGVLFGTGTYSAFTGDPSITGQTNGRIGINVVNPTQALHVSGNTLINGSLTANTISATTYYNLPNTTFTGGSVTGPTSFTNGLTANTISATTYYNLPLDVKVTGSSLNAGTYDFTLTRNDGVTITSNLGLLSTDIKVTGGTYNINTGVVTFTNNSGGTFNVTGFTSGMTDTYTTGGTVSSGTATFTKSNGSTYAVSGFATQFTGGTISGATNFTNGVTANTISATTYYGLPKDNTITGGTYAAGTATFTNNTGGTFNVTGFSTSTGTVTSVAALTLGTSGADLSSTVANGTTTPVITLNVPDASATARGVINNTVQTIGGVKTFNSQINGTVGSFSQSVAATTLYGYNSLTNSIGVEGGAANGTAGYFANNSTTYPVVKILGLSNTRLLEGRNTSDVITFAVTSAGAVSGSSFIKSGGSSSQFLKADGSVDSTIYSSGFTGGTVAGATNFTGGLTANTISATSITATNLNVTGGTQSLFSGNSSVELVKIIQNGSGDAFVVEDIANGDASHFVINASGNTAIGLTQPLGTDKLTVSGDTSIYGAFKATTISATTYFNLPTDVRVTGGTYAAGTATFTNNTGGTFTVTGFSTSSATQFTGGTVSGATNFTGGLTANTFSATTIVVGNQPSLNTTTGITINAGSTTIYTLPTGYNGVFFDYTVNNGTNFRSGNIMGVTNNTSVQYTETSTNDIGNTSGLTFSMSVSAGQAILVASAATNSWVIKTIIRTI